MKLEGKTVVIAGATGGIGCHVTQEFAGRGAKLVLVARNEEKIKELIKEIGGEHDYFLCDLSSVTEIEKVGKEIVSKYSVIDVLINAAGVGVYKTIEYVEEKDWATSFALNASAPYFMTKALLLSLQKAEKSVSLCIGSGMGKMPTPGRSAYCMSKFALRGAMLSVAQEFEGTNVNIVHITLGSTLTDFGPMSLQDKEEASLQGKAYLTPSWVAKKFADIIESDNYEQDIEVYPSDYSEGGNVIN